MLKRWLIYFAALFAALLFQYYYPDGVSVSLVVVILCLPVLSLIYAVIGALSLKASFTQESDTAQRGKSLPVKICVKNGGPLPYPLASVIYSIPEKQGMQRCASHVSVRPFGEYCAELSLNAEHCGEYEFGLERASVSDLFGLFCFPFRKKHGKSRVSRLILPRVEAPEQPFRIPSVESEEESSAELRHAAGGSVNDVRAYESGDSLRDVHWKMTAKCGELMIKEYAAGVKTGVLVVPDFTDRAQSPAQRLFDADGVMEVTMSVLRRLQLDGTAGDLIWWSGAQGRTERQSLSPDGEIELLRRRLAYEKLEKDLPGAAETAETVLSAREREYACVIFVVSGAAFDLALPLDQLHAAHGISVVCLCTGESSAARACCERLDAAGILAVPVPEEYPSEFEIRV